MIILDTSGLLAAIDASQRHHRAAAQPVPGLTPVRTFDQTTELSLNERLVASSNS